MTQPAQPKTVTTELVASDLLEQMISERVNDDTVASRSLEDFQASLTQHQNRVQASIKLTYPEDWVVYETKDGKKLCYLQDDGCERVEPIWQIEFDKLDIAKDVLDETIELSDKDVHRAFTVQMSGRCRVTGARRDELGFRSTGDGFFEKQWLDARHEPATRARLAANVRKSAMVNAKGRIVRGLTGLASVPIDVLTQHGLDTKRCRGIRFESGTQGGSGDMPSTPQIKACAAAAALKGKVEGYTRKDMDSIADQITSHCAITKRDISKLIEELNSTEKPMAKAEFWKRLKYTAPAKPDAAPPAGESKAPPPSDGTIDEDGNCVACFKAVSKGEKHGDGCPNGPQS